MAVDRDLKDSEKEAMIANSSYQDQCEWALRNFSSYWADASDAEAKITAVGPTRWAKNWVYSSRVLERPLAISGTSLYVDFMILSKGMLLWDSAITPFDADVCVQYMIDNGKFDLLASDYVTQKTPTPLGF